MFGLYTMHKNLFGLSEFNGFLHRFLCLPVTDLSACLKDFMPVYVVTKTQFTDADNANFG